MNSRILIVSNRLPITLKREASTIRVERSSGGLATGLSSTYQQGGGVWIGWPGFSGEIPESQAEELQAQFREMNLVAVSVSEAEMERFYGAYCNGILWPLFHSFPSQLPLETHDFEAYREANVKFADAVAAVYRPGDRIWVHDYQLMLLPRLLRDRIPDASIGFFLHIPFPSSDTFRTLPARVDVLDGLLASDLIGFHTAGYMRNFASSVLYVLGAQADMDTINWQGRVSNMAVLPMGVDAPSFDALGRDEAVRALSGDFRGPGGEQLLVGIDRLDYTKGIPRRLLAYERLLADHPELHGNVRLVQAAVPSRTGVDAYADFRNQVDALVGRINGRFGSPCWSPVHYIYRSLSTVEVAALYCAADTLLVTPIRDGMNLVAKEFIATRTDGLGVLVLSEFAGAAAELAEAVHVNPYDIEGSARAYFRALSMGDAERRTRMSRLRHRVFSYDIHWWARTFLATLEQCSQRADLPAMKYSPRDDIEQALAAIGEASSLVLFLDYDGTLVPIAATPELAEPDAEIRDLLTSVASRPGTEVHVVSGRGRDTLEQWLGDLPLALHAEHGQWTRSSNGEWTSREQPPDTWRAAALEILEEAAARTPGSLVEQKRSGIAWHYRMADPVFGARQANELKVHLSSMLSNAPVEVLSGDKVVELRPHGANKGTIPPLVLQAHAESPLAVAFGDDRTDEDLFEAIPESGYTFHVGPSASRARLRIRSVRDVRAALRTLLD